VGQVEKRLEEMDLTLPEVAPPLAQYVPAKLVGDLVYCSGQLPVRDGAVIYKGHLGADLMLEEGVECARLCALNCLAAARSVIGDLDRVAEVVRVCGFVSSAPGFVTPHDVLNGASDLLVEVFGEAGRHVRAAVGVAALPANAPVEVEMILRVRDEDAG